MPDATDAFKALCELQTIDPTGRFTTAEVALMGGAAPGAAGHWTAPWRDALFACHIAGLVLAPEGRPHRWGLNARGWERARVIAAVEGLGDAMLNQERTR